MVRACVTPTKVFGELLIAKRFQNHVRPYLNSLIEPFIPAFIYQFTASNFDISVSKLSPVDRNRRKINYDGFLYFYVSVFHFARFLDLHQSQSC